MRHGNMIGNGVFTESTVDVERNFSELENLGLDEQVFACYCYMAEYGNKIGEMLNFKAIRRTTFMSIINVTRVSSRKPYTINEEHCLKGKLWFDSQDFWESNESEEEALK